ncbi:hypothetical protein [Prochlorothrix hollandica]|uniref:hypothetical protein n=1 Tax=Prochlorothrix hollandica TaxID=1223 RepID=UPI00034DD40F|nr:hypothetical protein [Prochlorothrix hollandica]
MSRKAESITLSVRDWEKAKLQALAAEWGQTWGDKPNISKLIKAIAQGTLRIAPNHNWSDDRINSLNLARNLLIDQGRRDDALVLAQLLLERSEPNHPLRQEIQAFVDRPVLTQRLELERYCQQQQPFRLTYGDAADRLWHFTVRHGRIMPQDDRDYLFCWCEETAGNQDLPALSHNWCLRLDRILPEANLSPMTGPWRGDLDPTFSRLFKGIKCLRISQTKGVKR